MTNYDVIRQILREHSSRENVLGITVISKKADEMGYKIGRNAIEGFMAKMMVKPYETEEECDELIKQCSEDMREVYFCKMDLEGRRTRGYWMMEALSDSECMLGNHEDMALDCLKFFMTTEITEQSLSGVSEEMLENLVTWQYNGSKTTIDGFRVLDRAKQQEVIDFIEDMPEIEEISVAGQKYLLVHGGLGDFYPGKPINDYTIDELIWARAEYDIQYFDDTYVVTGHTPTKGIPGNPRPGYIYRQNNHIAIDCGAVRRSGRLAAIRLDDGKEFYTGD